MLSNPQPAGLQPESHTLCRRVPPGTLFVVLSARILSLAMLVTLLMPLVLPMLAISACQAKPKFERFTYSFTGSFDTVVQLVAYTETQDEFDRYAQDCEAQFLELHHLFDIYNTYGELNNIRTINQNAGREPVIVDQRIINLIDFYLEHDYLAPGKVNIALGPVLALWHDYRAAAESGTAAPAIPPLADLKAAAKHIDPAGIEIDRTASTVRLADPAMRLDVGAVAKGYATELVAKSLESKGLRSAILSAGGSNVRLIGAPLDTSRKSWQIGIQNPFGNLLIPDEAPVDVILANATSVVTSGDYQRTYIVDGISYHHLIDPATLMPANYVKAVTIVTPDSGLGDYLSTAVFLLPYEQGLALVESLPNCEALWIFADGTMKTSSGMAGMLRDHGQNPILNNE
jgi:thiamine biosynthesis lipoprotein